VSPKKLTNILLYTEFTLSRAHRQLPHSTSAEIRSEKRQIWK